MTAFFNFSALCIVVIVTFIISSEVRGKLNKAFAVIGGITVLVLVVSILPNPKDEGKQAVAAAASPALPAAAVTQVGSAKEKCYPQTIDPSWNRNDNKPGTACHKQMQKVRKLEFDPNFDCSKEIRQQWQLELDIAEKMKCNL